MSEENRRKKPRKKFISCIAMKQVKGEMKLLREDFEITDLEVAEKRFKEKHKISPTELIGPYMPFHGNQPSTEKVAISIRGREAAYTNNRWTGIYAGWEVIAHGLKAFRDFNDDEIVHITQFERAIEPGTRKPRFGAAQVKAIPRSELQDAKAL